MMSNIKKQPTLIKLIEKKDVNDEKTENSYKFRIFEIVLYVP